MSRIKRIRRKIQELRDELESFAKEENEELTRLSEELQERARKSQMRAERLQGEINAWRDMLKEEEEQREAYPNEEIERIDAP